MSFLLLDDTLSATELVRRLPNQPVHSIAYRFELQCQTNGTLSVPDVICLMPTTPSITQLFYAFLLALLFSLHSAQAQVSVEVAEVLQEEAVSELHLTGNIVSTRSVTLGSEIAAQVASVHCEVGDVVEEGQLLIQLDDQPTKLELAIKQAELKESTASARLAELEEMRLKKLLAEKSVSTERYDQAFAQLQRANAAVSAQEAEIALLSDAIARHRIHAPFAGVITERPVDQGSWSATGSSLVELSALNALRMQLSLPQQYYASLMSAVSTAKRSTKPAHLISASISRSKFTAAVEVPIERLVPFTDAQRNFQVWLSLDNRKRQWLPGMSANAKLRWQSESDNGLSITRDALVRNINGQVYVWKISPSANEQSWVVNPIEVIVNDGPGLGGRVVIWPAKGDNNALNPGDRVVTRGNESLQPEQKVRPILLREAGA